jgi:DNA-binding CsgD family transcriptional regulator
VKNENEVFSVNDEAYKYCEENRNLIHDLCFPIKNYLGVENFFYSKIFYNGEYLYISNNLEWQRFYFERVHEFALVWPGETHIHTSSLKGFVPVLWPENPTTKLTQCVYDFGLWNGFHFFREGDGYREFWRFCGCNSDTHLRQFYWNHIDLFLQYIQHFEFSVQDLISLESGREKLARFKNGVILPNEPMIPRGVQMDEFLDSISPLKKYQFSKRELECFSFLAKGQTAKEIAQHLNISHRTVERYMLNIKAKTGLVLRSDLVKLFHDNWIQPKIFLK